MRLTSTALAFLTRYNAELPRLERAARDAVVVVRAIAAGSGVDLLGVEGRAKTASSVREKLRRKNYASPWDDLTDKIGIRVTTYYGSDVEPVVAALKTELEVDGNKSVDKRSGLGLREFGYRSVHLIARLTAARARNAEHADLSREWFEIQVRSVFEHAWAEIEHEVVYKSGLEFPDTTRRRFAALAGTLELLEREFGELRKEGRALVEAHRASFERHQGLDDKLDVARCLAAVALVRPESRPFLGVHGQRLNVPASTAKNCLVALDVAGIKTPRALLAQLRSARYRGAISTYAAEASVPEAQVSQLAAIAIAVGLHKGKLLEEWLPDLLADRALTSAVEGTSGAAKRSRRRGRRPRRESSGKRRSTAA